MNTNIDVPLDEILSPDFDASTLTKQQLRSLLSEVGLLDYESLPAASAKKQVYLDSFQKHIYEKRAKIVQRLTKLKTSPIRDIILVDQDGSQRLISPFQLQDAKSRAGKKVDFNLQSGHFSTDNPFQSPKDGPARGRSGQRPQTPVPTRRTRASSHAKSRRKASTDVESDRASSGSDVETEALAQGRSRRRQAKGPSVPEEMTARRRASVSPTLQQTRSRSQSTSGHSSSPSRRSRPLVPASAQPESGERLAETLTPVTRIRAPVYKTAMDRATKQRAFLMLGSTWWRRGWQILILLVLFALFVLYLDFYSRVPVCLSREELRVPLDTWSLMAAAPFCRSVSYCWPCPQYGDCHADKQVTSHVAHTVRVQCHPGFKLTSHLLGFPACQLDPRQVSTISALAMAMHDHLAVLLGSALCAYPHLYDETSSNWSSEPTLRSHAMMSDAALRKLFGTTRSGAWSEDNAGQGALSSQSFDFFFDSALGKLMNGSISRDFPLKIERHYSVQSKKRATDEEELAPAEKFRLMALVPSFSLYCAFKVYGRQVILRHATGLFLTSVGLTLFLLFLSRSRARKRRHFAAQQLKEAVLRKLVEQEYLNRTDPIHYPSTVPAIQLRDALLPSVDTLGHTLSSADKKIVWRLVSMAVTGDSNVRESVTEWKGEQVRVWEWIGSAVLSLRNK